MTKKESSERTAQIQFILIFCNFLLHAWIERSCFVDVLRHTKKGKILNIDGDIININSYRGLLVITRRLKMNLLFVDFRDFFDYWHNFFLLMNFLPELYFSTSYQLVLAIHNIKIPYYI